MSRTKALRAARVALAIGAILVLTGCTRGMSDLREGVAQEKQKKGAPIPPLPVIKDLENFGFSPEDSKLVMRDNGYALAQRRPA